MLPHNIEITDYCGVISSRIYLKCDLGWLGEGGRRKHGLDLRHDLGTDDSAVRADDGDVETDPADGGEVQRKVLSHDTRGVGAR